jgi:DNA polymerase I-like protein with 3'-5' exonuclease and polymerase domains
VIGYPRLIVHDEKDFSVAAGWNEKAFAEMVHVMQTAIPFKVPIRVEGEWGPNWSELYSLK